MVTKNVEQKPKNIEMIKKSIYVQINGQISLNGRIDRQLDRMINKLDKFFYFSNKD